jgi:hypothetical protein
MKARGALVFLVLLIFSCKKSSITNSSGNTSNTGGAVHTAKDTSFISANVGGAGMIVTSIHYNRGSATFNFTAQNDLQRIDVYCFHFYESSGLNYQYSDSINYSKREDVYSAWSTSRAIGWGDVYFDCCAGPLEDKVISGVFSGDFPNGESKFKINGQFHLIF